MNLELKVAMLRRGVHQTRMAVALRWDPAKLSRIVNQTAVPTDEDRKAIADFLGVPKEELFASEGSANGPRKIAATR